MNETLHRFEVEEFWMTEHRKTHPEIEILERFAMGRLDEPELGSFEEHLLQCEHCQERLDETTAYVALMREATGNVASAEPLAPPEEAAWRRWLRFEWLMPPTHSATGAAFRTPALAGAMMLAVAFIVWAPWHAAAPGEWRTVELETMRGATSSSAGMEGYALHLRLDVTGLDAAGANAQIVNSGGSELAAIPVAVVAGKAEIRYAPGLSAGQYWVRLKKSGETIREYALMVTPRKAN